ncbi:MAG: type I methionyl aminopeptidase [Clostridiales bacterium]|jgi:methionyl aminopeptidase|nr:type I methionyl aminopeptidase [Clostridiales bacterium]
MFEGISIKSKREIEIMRESGKILRDAHLLIGEKIREGISTLEIDKIAYNFITSNKAVPSFLGYNGFKGAACVSINEELLHGIPRADKIIGLGDIIKIDLGVCLKGFHTDAARTYAVGAVAEEYTELIERTKQSFFEGVKLADSNHRLGDVSHAIGEYAESFGYGVVRAYIGHGVGARLHEPPDIPNYGQAGRGIRLREGMTLAIEPMVNIGSYEVEVLSDGWTVVTKDKKMCAHYENTIVITDNGAEILTL